ncbi:PRAME family member 4-like [Mesocricetus auratus]|uniref:PRAME family member 4-like n=1 Tax=Mesocricetus auratus TaxID=10036 RepID=A0A3Q0CV12_MESAU|nr:PRAME family member 4-like [Mesocricetus auratus]XP_040613370.1 PRAME family member 4-like [Mesocricetus auratus]
MSFQDVPTLQQLAIRGLLKDEDLTLSLLDDLPIVLFPPLFEQAFINRQTKIVKTMVTSWPFPCLPLGSLIHYVEADNFQAVLDGMDWLINETVWPRRCRLRVLNLHYIEHGFWERCVGTENGFPSQKKKEPLEKDPTTEGKKPKLQVLAEYTLMFQTLKDYNSCFLQWLSLRKDIVRIYFFNLVPKKK